MDDDDEKTWDQGFTDGFRSIRGRHALIPLTSGAMAEFGKTEYQSGYDRGRAQALQESHRSDE